MQKVKKFWQRRKQRFILSISKQRERNGFTVSANLRSHDG